MRAFLQYWGSIPLEGGYVAGFDVGPDAMLYVLVCMGEPDDSWIVRRARCDWRVLVLHADGWCSNQLVRDQEWNFDKVQPLPGGLLLATSRCEYKQVATASNGHIFDNCGQLVGNILLGDGIQDLQTTTAGDIWASYADEGIFGNLGWEHPIGDSGLLGFDVAGSITFRYKPPTGLERIINCYCLNVIRDRDVWLYYYPQFAIVQMAGDRVIRHWAPAIEHATGMAIWRDLVLMQRGYDQTGREAGGWQLLRLGEKATPFGDPLVFELKRGKKSLPTVRKHGLTAFGSSRMLRSTGSTCGVICKSLENGLP